MGSDVEGRIGCPYAFGSNGCSLDMGYLLRASLFDGDFVSRAQGKVNGAGGSSHIEGDAILLSQNSQTVGANLIGGITIGGNSVGTNNDAANLPPAHKVASHRVGNEGNRNISPL